MLRALFLFFLSGVSVVSVAQTQQKNRCTVTIENLKLQTELQPIFVEVKSSLQNKQYRQIFDGSGAHTLALQMKYSNGQGEDITRTFAEQYRQDSRVELGYVSLIFKFRNTQSDETLFYAAQSGLIQINGFSERYINAVNANSYTDQQLQKLKESGKVTSEKYDQILTAKQDEILNLVNGLARKALASLPDCQTFNQARVEK